MTTSRHSDPNPALAEAADLLGRGDIAGAERIARAALRKNPTDAVALGMLAEIALRVRQYDDAARIFERCLELAPGFHAARQAYALALSHSQRFGEALAQMDRLLAAEPENPQFSFVKATIHTQMGDHPQALRIYEAIADAHPDHAETRMNLAHALAASGRIDEAIAAYRRAIELRPAAGEGYWSLANLKTYRFSDAEIDAIRREIRPDGGDPDDQAHLLFALGQALEDRGEFEQSFAAYEKGNRIRSAQHRFDARWNVSLTTRQVESLDAAFFDARRGWGCDSPDPIFVVGMPRAGSTLIEQILASHTAVEGTAELHEIVAMSRRLADRSRSNPDGNYPEVLATLTEAQARELGEFYIESTRVQRHGKPFFVDKMPNNFQHVGLIRLILPNAKVIDARRHPMACCFSCFKQLFAGGQAFTYSLADLGQYYGDYLKLMDHWDDVLPGFVHRIQYEDMVGDTENVTRQLLEFCGLPFEEECLRFYETKRSIQTPSAEQVRQPVYSSGVDQWRNFEPWLDPLKEALGPVLGRYPVASS